MSPKGTLDSCSKPGIRGGTLIVSLLELVPLFWGETLALAAHSGGQGGRFALSFASQKVHPDGSSLSSLPQELDKNFLPELTVAYDILAFILPNKVVGGFVWGLL